MIIDIKSICDKTGLTQVEVAEEIGTTPQYLTNLQNEKMITKSIKVLHKLSKLSGIPINDLIIKRISPKYYRKQKITWQSTDHITKEDGIDFDLLLEFINKTLNKDFININKNLQDKFKARLKEGYTIEDIQKAIVGASEANFHIESNYKNLTPEFFSKADKIDMYSN